MTRRKMVKRFSTRRGQSESGSHFRGWRGRLGCFVTFWCDNGRSGVRRAIWNRIGSGGCGSRSTMDGWRVVVFGGLVAVVFAALDVFVFDVCVVEMGPVWESPVGITGVAPLLSPWTSPCRSRVNGGGCGRASHTFTGRTKKIGGRVGKWEVFRVPGDVGMEC